MKISKTSIHKDIGTARTEQATRNIQYIARQYWDCMLCGYAEAMSEEECIAYMKDEIYDIIVSPKFEVRIGDDVSMWIARMGEEQLERIIISVSSREGIIKKSQKNVDTE